MSRPARPTRDENWPASAHAVLADLVALVSDRAINAGSAGGESPDGLESLRVAVEALDAYLGILQVMRDAGGDGPPTPRSDATVGGEVAGPPVWSARLADPTPAAPETAPPRARFPPFRDQATGLLSRDGFDAGVDAEVRRCGRHSRPMTILVLRLGGTAAAVMGKAGVALRRGLRASDLVGRDGDRDLLVALPEAQEDEAAGVASRAIRLLSLADGWDMDSSVGLAAYPVDGETPAALLDRARRRLDPFTEPSHSVDPTSAPL